MGELLVSLSYYPSNNTLTIAVLKVGLEQSFQAFQFCLSGKKLESEGYQWKIRPVCEGVVNVWRKACGEEEDPGVQM